MNPRDPLPVTEDDEAAQYQADAIAEADAAQQWPDTDQEAEDLG